MAEATSNQGTPAALSFNGWLRWDLLQRLLPDGGSFLEIGCGQGGLAVRLASRFDYTGYEPDVDSFEVAQARLTGRGRVLNAMLPVHPTGAFDVVGAFEVLEHIEDDQAALARWRDWLVPGGLLVLSVPSHGDRFGPWDVAVGHFRRYERDDLSRLLSAAGYEEVLVFSYGFPLGFVLEWARNRLAPKEEIRMEERTARSGRLLQPAGRSWITQTATAPFRWMQLPMRRTDIGTGYVASAHRPA